MARTREQFVFSLTRRRLTAARTTSRKYWKWSSMLCSKLNQRMHDSLLEGLSPKSFHTLTYHKIYEITIISILECILWDPYIYLKVVVSDEKVPEDSGLVEIAQTDHVFNSLVGNNLVVVMIIVIVMPTSLVTSMTFNEWRLHLNIYVVLCAMLCTNSPGQMLCASVWFSSPAKATAPPRRRQPPWVHCYHDHGGVDGGDDHDQPQNNCVIIFIVEPESCLLPLCWSLARQEQRQILL